MIPFPDPRRGRAPITTTATRIKPRRPCSRRGDQSSAKCVSSLLIPLLFVLYVFAYLDKINIGFAALSMNRELGLSATMFGVANTIFYLGYLLCEVPSNLLLVRFGARRWIPRIMITWGLASTATMFAVGPNSLYAISVDRGYRGGGIPARHSALSQRIRFLERGAPVPPECSWLRSPSRSLLARRYRV